MNTKRLLTVFVVGYFCVTISDAASRLDLEGIVGDEDNSVERLAKDIKEDSRMRVDELITKHGYIGETHNVETEDGYILTAHRIRNDNGKPIFLQHGLIDSSAGYVVMGPNASLAYILADLGYDVWLGNARGNRYSRGHTTMSVESESFWDFSWHEIGYYDIPAMINYVLETTKNDKLDYIGHSQGCTSFFVMCATRPEFNNKIKSMQALAPAVYMSETKDHPYLRIVELYVKNPVITRNTGILSGEFKFICKMSSDTLKTCMEALFSIIGRNKKEFNLKMFPVVLGHYPAGASAKQIRHFLQIINSGRFAEYNYGTSENLFKYRQFVPPIYNMSRVTAPIYIHYSANDLLVSPIDVEHLYEDLVNPMGKYLVPMKEFNHMDFLWAINAKTLVYDQIVKVLQKKL